LCSACGSFLASITGDIEKFQMFYSLSLLFYGFSIKMPSFYDPEEVGGFNGNHMSWKKDLKNLFLK
jgi:hypothetical protein